MPDPLVSIITPVLNMAGTIERCLDSVRRQDYPRVEHIVVDGASSDETCAILARRADQLGGWISEPDDGTASAFNKGVHLARGEIMSFLNADDWYEPDAVSGAVAALTGSGADFTYGSVGVHAAGGKLGTLSPLPPSEWPNRCLYEMPVPHISMFLRRQALERIGRFDERCTNTSDHDQFVRLIMAGCRGVALQGIVGHIRTGGNADSLRALRESWAIARRHGAPAGISLLRSGRHGATFGVRKTARLLLGERGSARLLQRLGSRHASA